MRGAVATAAVTLLLCQTMRTATADTFEYVGTSTPDDSSGNERWQNGQLPELRIKRR